MRYAALSALIAFTLLVSIGCAMIPGTPAHRCAKIGGVFTDPSGPNGKGICEIPVG